MPFAFRLSTVLAVTALSAGLSAQSPEFEVASVKLHASDDQRTLMVAQPGGRFVLHAHSRFFRGLGWKRAVAQRLKRLFGSADAGDVTMPQAYGGAPLTQS